MDEVCCEIISLRKLLPREWLGGSETIAKLVGTAEDRVSRTTRATVRRKRYFQFDSPAVVCFLFPGRRAMFCSRSAVRMRVRVLFPKFVSGDVQ
jgi:hypothetical protein